MITEALLIWLVTFISFLAFFGFVLFVARSFGTRRWTNTALLRTASSLAFLAATAFWILVVIVD